MPNLISKLPATALALVLALPVQAQDAPTADTVVATVDGTEITLGHMILVRAGLDEQYQQLPPDVLWDGILDQLVQQTALSEDSAATESKRVRIALENERRALLASETLAAAAKDAVSDEAIQAAYDETYANAEPVKEFSAAHILVETEDEAKALVEELEGGADFATLAKEKSTGPSGPNGGELGWFSAGMMVEPFQAAVETMEPGAVSEPVQTQFGWQVIKLMETRDKAAPAIDEVRAQIEAELQRSVIQARIDEVVAGAEVTRTAKDEIDTTVLNQLDLLEE